MYTMALDGATADIWAQVILCCVDYSVHCRMVSSLPGLLARRKTLLPPVVITKTMSRLYQVSLGAESPWVENR